MEAFSKKYLRNEIFVFIILLVACWVLYGAQLHLFTDMIVDDHMLRTKIRLHQLKNIPSFFTDPVVAPHHYRPLSETVRAVQYYFFHYSMTSYRFFNLFIFYICCVLIFKVIQKLTKNFDVAIIAALLFCVHPINNLVIFYVWGVDFSLACIFLLLSILNFYSFLKNKSRLNYGLSLLLFVMALLFQEIHMIYPCFLIISSFFQEKNKLSVKQHVFFLLPFVLISGIYYMFRLNFFDFISVTIQHQESLNLFLSSYLASLMQLIIWYIKNLIYPNNFVLIWNISPVKDNLIIINLCFVFVLSFTNWLIFFKWKRDCKTFALVWFLIGFLPIVQAMFIMPVLGLVIEPHWFLFSSIGYYLLIAIGINKIYQNVNRKLGILLFCVLFLFLCVRNKQHQLVWKNEKVYCEYWLGLMPSNPIPRARLGIRLAREGNYKKALENYEIVVKNSLYERDTTLVNIGMIHAYRNDLISSARYFHKAIEFNPSNASAYNGLGALSLQDGDLKDAEQKFELAVKYDPYHVSAMLNLAKTHYHQREIEEAVKWFEQILQIDPRNDDREEVFVKLAALYFNQKKYNESLTLLNQCLDEFPQNKEAYLLLGNVLGNQGWFHKAISIWEKGKMIDPMDKRFSDNILKAQGLLRK